MLLVRHLTGIYGVEDGEIVMHEELQEGDGQLLMDGKSTLAEQVMQQDVVVADHVPRVVLQTAKKRIEILEQRARKLMDQKQSVDEKIKALLRTEQEDALEQVVKKHCPHLHDLLGTVLTAQLLAEAGDLERLAKSSASKVQVLGAEASFFKALHKGKGFPKFGLLGIHPMVQRAEKKGKAARKLALKVVIAARRDYFGE